MRKGIAIGLRNKEWHERNGIKRKRRRLARASRRKAMLLGSVGATAPQINIEKLKESDIESRIVSQSKPSLWKRIAVWFNNSILR